MVHSNGDIPLTNGGVAATNGTKSTNGMPLASQSLNVTLKDKVIAITGANQGIGLALAEACLANAASRVYSLDIKDPGKEFLELQSKHPGALEHIKVDVTNQAEVESSLDAIVEATHRLDGLVANAGITAHKSALDFSQAEVERLWKINVMGTWNCATAAARMFLKLNTKGSIVMTASMASYGANKTVPSTPYSATKAAIRSMAKTMAMEWADHSIRVNSVSPGFILTELSYHVRDAPDWDTKMKYWRGMPRLALPQELGGAYVYLLSDSASYTTGIDIPVAGSVGAW